jgi:hypothetical protein
MLWSAGYHAPARCQLTAHYAGGDR